MDSEGKIVSCRFDPEDYQWLQRVKAVLQKGNVGTVTDSAILRDLVRNAKQGEIYGKIEE